MKNITKRIKSQRRISLCTKGVKSVVNKTIGHANEIIGHVNETIQPEELEIINVMTKCDNEACLNKKTLDKYYIKGEENILRYKSRDGYVCMYECCIHLLHSMYERACAAYQTTISHMKEIVEIFNPKINEICSTNR